MADIRNKRDSPSVSSITSFIRWLQLKKYQYEVTFSLYMLTPAEKFVFNSILFILISLLVTAAYLYLPGHLFIVYGRVWYYISGEFTHDHNLNIMNGIGRALKTTKEIIITQTASSVIAKETMGRASQVAGALKDEL